jgi:hypothetical protein
MEVRTGGGRGAAMGIGSRPLYRPVEEAAAPTKPLGHLMYDARVKRGLAHAGPASLAAVSLRGSLSLGSCKPWLCDVLLGRAMP